MPNNYFAFKNFTIHQELCAMKVTTDACLFGAVVASRFIKKEHVFVLDIGTGTGLLSLMVAQKNDTVKIDAVEIDEAAAKQATTNAKSGAYAMQINVQACDIKNWELKQPYDFIFTNPPFFSNHLKSLKPGRNQALHDVALTLDELLVQINRLIKQGGLFSILLPYYRVDLFIKRANEFGWQCMEAINVKQTENHPYFRSILLFGRFQQEIKTTNIIIRKDKEYSAEFECLLKDCYLNL